MPRTKNKQHLCKVSRASAGGSVNMVSIVHKLFDRRLVDNWSEDDCRDQLPSNMGAQIPYGCLRAEVMWSQEAGKIKLGELIGMTKAAEKDVSDVWESINAGTSVGDYDKDNRRV